MTGQPAPDDAPGPLTAADVTLAAAMFGWRPDEPWLPTALPAPRERR